MLWAKISETVYCLVTVALVATQRRVNDSTSNYVRNSLTGTVRSLSNRWVEGTRCPPMLATKFTRSDESGSPLVTVDEERL